jgi:hypothetical protein
MLAMVSLSLWHPRQVSASDARAEDARRTRHARNGGARRATLDAFE